MALKCLAHIKKEGSFIILQDLKEENLEPEISPSSFFFYFKQEEEEELTPGILKLAPFGSSIKNEEPSENIGTSSQESEDHVPSVRFISDAPHTLRRQLQHRKCREKPVLVPIVSNSEVPGPTSSTTPSSSPCQTESEDDVDYDDYDDNDDDDDYDEDDDIIDPNWTLAEVPQTPSNAQTYQTQRGPRGQPRKICSDPKAAHIKSPSKPVKDSRSTRLPKKDMHVIPCKKKKKQCNKKTEKTKQSTSGLKSGTPRTAVCKTCGKAFLSKRDLQRHEHTHTGAKPFKCSVCERGFNDIGNMHKHMAVHTGAQPFTCKLCGRAFSERGNLRRHEFYVHEVQGENQRQWEPLWHQCPDCLRTFKYRGSLVRHMDSFCNGKRIGQRSRDVEKERNTKAKKSKEKGTRK